MPRDHARRRVSEQPRAVGWSQSVRGAVDHGSPEREIRLDHSIPLSRSTLSTSGLSADGRLLVPLAPRDSWFNPPAVIDTATGRITRIPSDNQSDYRSMGWTRDGEVIALKNGLRATLWKFQSAAR